jgi:hypothetical protein
MASAHKFDVFADYFQFLVMDEESADDFSELWTDVASERMIAAGETSISFGTLRNVDVRVEVEILDGPPNIDADLYDHIAETSFRIKSGKLVVMGCTGYLPDAPKIQVKPGTYRTLFRVSGVDTIKNEWEPADDLYQVLLWQDDPCETRLIKHWKKNAT